MLAEERKHVYKYFRYYWKLTRATENDVTCY